MVPHLRVARPVTDLERAARQYEQGLGFVELGRFSEHDGFSGVMVGPAAGPFHLELTVCAHHPVRPAPTVEDLLVFYVPEEPAWRAACERMRAAGFREIEAFNPYWSERGATFEDHDGYRTVLERAH